MGRRRNIVIAAILAACIFRPLHAAAADISIEQAQCVMPEINVYLRAENGLKQGSVQAILDGVTLPEPQITSFEESGDPVHYYIVLDNSGSVPKKYVAPLREAVTNFSSSLREQDTLHIYTVGESVQRLYEGSGKDTLPADVMEQYTANEMETVLFEALVQCANAAGRQSAEQPERSVLLVFSDGVNESVGVAVYDEAVQHLQEAELPVYAFGLGNDAEALDSFGRLARDTGGSLEMIKPEQTGEALQNSASSLLSDYYVVTAKAPTNEIGGSKELLIKCSDYAFSQTLTLRPSHWIPDETKPEVLSVEQEELDRLKITFSEDVQGADELSHYLLTLNGSDTPLPLYHVRYQNADGQYTALLEMEREPIRGDYTLTLSQITDVSQEKNPLKEAAVECGLEGRLLTEGGNDHTFLTLLLILMAAALAGVTAVLLLRRKQKPSEAANTDAGAGILQAAPDARQIHVQNPAGVPRALHLTVRSPNAEPVQMEAVIEQQLTFGRSSHCQVYFDDPSMSRRHFELRVSGTELWLTDCGSMGGTRINGLPVTEPTQLSQGDTVTAGVTEITVRW